MSVRRPLASLEAIRKMSSAVATRLSIHDRGVLQTGFFYIVGLDPATIIDRATFEAPRQLSARSALRINTSSTRRV